MDFIKLLTRVGWKEVSEIKPSGRPVLEDADGCDDIESKQRKIGQIVVIERFIFQVGMNKPNAA